MYIHQSIHFDRLTRLEQFGVESIWLDVRLKHIKPIRICFLYRNPSEHVDWMNHFSLMMENALEDSFEIMILGDFNLDLFSQLC